MVTVSAFIHKGGGVRYHQAMIPVLKNLLSDIETWPAEDQLALVDAARAIEAARGSRYQATPDELAGIDRGLADMAAGRVASDKAVDALRAKFRRA